MIQVVSISLGSSSRDHDTKMSLLGKEVRVRRIGVDGDFQKARKLFLDLDDEVDAFGMGGCEFGINFDERYYALRSIPPLIEGINSPVVDGSGIRAEVEYDMGRFLSEELTTGTSDSKSLPVDLTPHKRVLVCVGSARWDLVRGFHDAGYTIKFGDPGFVLGLPIGSTNYWLARKAGRLFIPLVVKAPFNWLYPTGKSQHQSNPKFRKWFEWADVIADDFHYIKRHMPESLAGKIIVTNTTTAKDQEMLRSRGASHLITSTPVLEGRTFGTNVLEAIMTAVGGTGKKLSVAELKAMLDEIGFEPPVIKLN